MARFAPTPPIKINRLTLLIYRLQAYLLAIHIRTNSRFKSQGRIHGYPSRVRVGRGRIWGHFIIWARAMRPKTAKTLNKVCWTNGPTDGPTDRQSGL